jgi:hypothetical protein
MLTYLTRAEIERALDNGQLFIAMQNGNHWRARRNGATKTWKTRPDKFSIPFKCGLKSCGRIDAEWLNRNNDWFQIRS